VKSYSGGIRHDYKDSAPSALTVDRRPLNRRGLSWFAVGLVLPLAALMLFLVSEPNESMVPPPDVSPTGWTRTVVTAPLPGEYLSLELPPLTGLAGEPETIPSQSDLERAAMLAEGDVLTLRIEAGDSLDRLFRGNGLSASDLAQMADLPEAGRQLTMIKPGDEIQIVRDDSRVLALTRELSESQELWIRRDEEGFRSQVIDLETETRIVGAHGTIRRSLFEDGIEAGLSEAIIIQMALGIFSWDIDFILDVRVGDSFTVVHEEVWRDGEKLRDGPIVAAEFVNRGTAYRAARYVDANGRADYYTPEGLSMRRAFDRNPIEFTRISSNFNPNRRHPILNTIRAHRGVDYAAPTGTPVRAAGDGKVEFRGVNGGYGNAVVLQHGGNITTLYAHLSRFGKYAAGARVKQGDVIGYVGATGQATGPHLHYEYRRNGAHQDPRTVELPPADPVPPEYRSDFETQSVKLWRQLDLYEGTRLAAVSD
jgi:murein DD-endopeptidase MepM/ murein hydrolase activator NlpD